MDLGQVWGGDFGEGVEWRWGEGGAGAGPGVGRGRSSTHRAEGKLAPMEGAAAGDDRLGSQLPARPLLGQWKGSSAGHAPVTQGG